jgi:hypothetical protein
MQVLKPETAKWIISLGVTPEQATLNNIIEAAKAHEESELYARGFQNQKSSMPSGKGTAYNKQGGPHTAPQFPQKTLNSQLKSSTFQKSYQGPRVETSRSKPAISSFKPAQREGKPPPKPTQVSSRPLGNQAGSITCYNCGNKGHYANACPSPKRNPQGFAANVIDDNDQEPSAEEGSKGTQEVQELPKFQAENQEESDSHSQDENPEGAQYEPEDEPDRYIWTDEEDNSPRGYLAHIVPLDNLGQLNTPQALTAKAITAKELPILSNQAKRKIPQVSPQPK